MSHSHEPLDQDGWKTHYPNADLMPRSLQQQSPIADNSLSPMDRLWEDTKRAQARVPKPPTWQSAFKKASLATAFIFIFLLVTNKFKVVPALVFALLAMLLYIPSGYYLDGYIYRRYQKKQLQKQ